MNLQFHYIEKLWQSFWSPKTPPSDGSAALPSRYTVLLWLFLNDAFLDAFCLLKMNFTGHFECFVGLGNTYFWWGTSDGCLLYPNLKYREHLGECKQDAAFESISNTEVLARLALLFGCLTKSVRASCLEEDNDKLSCSDPGFVLLSGSLLPILLPLCTGSLLPRDSIREISENRENWKGDGFSLRCVLKVCVVHSQ